ncbi:MAG: hypothetical protein WC058_11870 [Phycisphaeraceae bacterium]
MPRGRVDPLIFGQIVNDVLPPRMIGDRLTLAPPPVVRRTLVGDRLLVRQL